ncbi:carbohydrate ABC transporter permease [Glutamicibacter arilaitensis]|uniref:carbohydrate ABC transporter permease n=1 Tax=Glutamicibacter arilaitensis TaxID=256701 RepID=UPI00384D8C4D
MTTSVQTPPRSNKPITPREVSRTLQRSSIRRGRLFPYALIGPAAFLELLIHIIPMILGVWIAFLSLTQFSIANWVTAPFIGLQNFTTALNPDGPIGSQFFDALGRTLVFTILVVGIAWSLGIFAAVLLASKFRSNGFFRTLFLIPYALPSYVTTIAWAFMFNQRDGMVNRFLVEDLGILDEGPFWLLGGNSFFVMVVVAVWQFWPFAFLMLLAALQSIPTEVYEAASLDGASLWRQFTRITLPMIKHANVVLLLMLGLWVFNQFDIPYLLFGPVSPEEATLISPLIYQQSFNNWNFGVGGALSVVLLIALLIVSAFYIRLVMPKGKSIDD